MLIRDFDTTIARHGTDGEMTIHGMKIGLAYWETIPHARQAEDEPHYLDIEIVPKIDSYRSIPNLMGSDVRCVLSYGDRAAFSGNFRVIDARDLPAFTPAEAKQRVRLSLSSVGPFMIGWLV